MAHIAAALFRLKRAHELADCAGFAPVVKGIVKRAMSKISARWSDRLSVHLWDRLELSRRKMDDLRHLLST
eukprot:5705204-Prymnesium_polylepis.1